ncbi:hypothetical protein A0128_13520 [Leptospira tipperaryensis]|uniref:Uncharacterized protein n=1 Tax=Leptospira tipperaryensis TaxID=2564040 RepID=A0A1D7UYW6_9LEPT|nr:hypothetical protein [Leptospira tipperaryensis]AOP34777.1 hypothetical protein A0128_13520 [Leptospira tipperaryensis]
MISNKIDDLEILKTESGIVLIHKKFQITSIFLIGMIILFLFFLEDGLKMNSLFDTILSLTIFGILGFAIYTIFRHSFNSTKVKIDSEFVEILQSPFPTRPTFRIPKQTIAQVEIKTDYESESPAEFYSILLKLTDSKKVIVFEDLNSWEETQNLKNHIEETLRNIV